MFEANILPMDLQMIVDNELDRGERLLWTGQPKTLRFVLFSLPLVIFAIPWTGFSVFWMLGTLYFGQKMDGGILGWIFPLFALPFLLIGLGMLSTPFWISRRMKKTVYAVTNKRAIIFVKGFSTSVKSYDSKNISSINKRVKADGSGDLLFVEDIYVNSNGRSRTRQVGFWGISEVNKVEDMIEKIRQES